MIVGKGRRNIAIDSFVSTSGHYRCFLAEAYRPDMRFGGFATLRWYEVVFMRSDGKNFKKELGGELRPAMEQWEQIKEAFTARFVGQEEPEDRFEVMTYGNLKFTQEEADMLKMRPIGARLFLRTIKPIDEGTKQWNDAGLTLVQDESKMPRPTMGLVIRVGNDPFIQELARPGDVVSFSKFAGSEFVENGQVYRQIEAHEIQGVRTPEDGYDDLNLRDPANEAVVSDMKEMDEKRAEVVGSLERTQKALQ